MVPNGHTATYVFFNCIIRLGLFKKPLGFVRAVDLFLYKWNARELDSRSRPHDRKQRQSKNVALIKGIARGKPHRK